MKTVGKFELVEDKYCEFLHESFGLSDERSDELYNKTADLTIKLNSFPDVIKEIMNSDEFNFNEKIFMIFGLKSASDQIKKEITIKNLKELLKEETNNEQKLH